MGGGGSLNWNLLKWKIEGIFFPPLILRAEKLPLSASERQCIQTHSFACLFFYHNASAAGSPVWDGWASRLRGQAEIIDNPTADLTVNQLIPGGARRLTTLAVCLSFSRLLCSHKSNFWNLDSLLLHISLEIIWKELLDAAKINLLNLRVGLIWRRT